VAPNADQTYLFADGVHPTSAAQAIVAQFVESLIDGPIQYSLLAEAPLRTRASLNRTLTDGLLQSRITEVGKWSVFAAADGAGFDVNAAQGAPGLQSTLNTLAVGVTVRASESVTLGAAYGRSHLRGSFGNEKGNFRTNENALAVFGSMKWGGFYGTGIVSLADVEFNETQRKIVLGPVTRVATSNPRAATWPRTSPPATTSRSSATPPWARSSRSPPRTST
jgi:outer membrane lipase/esterase